MSRIGKKPIEIPSGVKVVVQGQTVLVEGPKGKLQKELPKSIHAKVEENCVKILRQSEEKKERALHGLFRSLVNNMVEGVSKGFEKNMEIVGTGYRARLEGKVLHLVLGYSHPITYEIPEGIQVKVERNTFLKVEGTDKEKVGSVAADIRQYYPPEPYKGKGIKFVGEHIRHNFIEARNFKRILMLGCF